MLQYIALALMFGPAIWYFIAPVIRKIQIAAIKKKNMEEDERWAAG